MLDSRRQRFDPSRGLLILYFNHMSKDEILDLLGMLREQYRGKGTCKILGGSCKCPLCAIDDAIHLVKTYGIDVQLELKVDIFVKPVISADYIELRLV